MKYKNIIIIIFILVIPITLYAVLSQKKSNDKTFANDKKPQIIKFTSMMCIDCQKLTKLMDEIYPNYSNKINLVEFQVQNNDEQTKNEIAKYNVALVPTLIILDKNGKKVSKIEGFVEKTQLEKIMKDLVNE